jgi:hypothetical protein
MENYTFAAARLKVLVQLLKRFSVVFKPKSHSSVPYRHWNLFLSMLRKAEPFFQSTFAKSLLHHCSPCYQLILCAYTLRLHHVLLTCHHIALSFVRNQYSRHDFKVHASALSAFLSVILPVLYFPLLNGCTWCNTCRIYMKMLRC